MILSLAVLGYESKAKNFISKFKNLSYFVRRASDTESVRIHAVHVFDDTFDTRDDVYSYVADEDTGNRRHVLNDQTQETKKETCIGNDVEWLVESDGHNVVVELSDEHTEDYLKIVRELALKGHLVCVTSSSIADSLKEENVLVFEDENAVFSFLEEEYQVRLAQHRKNLYEESLTETPCGLDNVS